ncbi:hypothetical protein IBL25_14955, partial [Roseomonas ludipueritiae]|nr:hypothetical protein [Pseudoroseomonas ludipueritiae]
MKSPSHSPKGRRPDPRRADGARPGKPPARNPTRVAALALLTAVLERHRPMEEALD